MAKKQTKKDNKAAPKKYSVVKMTCENCGEDVYYVLSCQHCGGDLVFSEALSLSQSEIKKLIETEDADFKGNLDKLELREATIDDDDAEGPDVGTMEVDDLDDLYNKGPFSAL